MRWWLCTFAAGLLVMVNCSGKKEPQFPNLPKSVAGWELASVEHYDRSTLYDYMDGGAELYLSFGFVRLTTGRYSRQEGPDIVAEVYQMDSSANAFGIFAHDWQGKPAGVGQDSEFEDGWLRFWKGNYYVSVYAEEPGGEADSAVLRLGRELATQIRTPGNRPLVTSQLPEEGRVPSSLRYFHDHVSLNHYYFLSRENVLGLDRQTEGALARYRDDGAGAVLALIRYPTANRAKAALERFYESYLKSEEIGDWVQLPNGKWAKAETSVEFLVIVFECSPREYGVRLLQTVHNLRKEGAK